jgi:hypothetical protein
VGRVVVGWVDVLGTIVSVIYKNIYYLYWHIYRSTGIGTTVSVFGFLDSSDEGWDVYVYIYIIIEANWANNG